MDIVVIVTDQHRYDCLSSAGNRQCPTPHLDRIASEGVRFERTFCTSAICTPARYSILSGLYPHQHGVFGNKAALSGHLPTFPKALRDAGWGTACIGKMHHTPTYLDVGFTHAQLAEQDGDGRFDDDYHADLVANGHLDAIDVIDQRREYRAHAPQSYVDSFGSQASDVPDPFHSTTWIGSKSVDVINSWDQRQQLLYVSFIKPHHPFDPPASWLAKFDPATLEPLPGYTTEIPPGDQPWADAYFDNHSLNREKLQQVMACYYASIAHIDEQVGRIRAALEAKGRDHDCMIVFTSDHGEFLGFHHMLLKGGLPYEPLARIPLIIRWPNRQRAGEVCQSLVSQVDIAPTILAAVNIPVPESMSGRNLSQPIPLDRIILSQRGDYLMARSDTTKLIIHAEPKHSRCYRLDQDPLEMVNRLGDPALAAEEAHLRETILRMQAFSARMPEMRLPHTPILPKRSPQDLAARADMVRQAYASHLPHG